jgi:hypothetical protein
MTFYGVDLRKASYGPLEDLIILNEKFDRLVEILDLNKRAEEKATGSTKPRMVEKSSLSSLKFILKANKKRPS